MNLEEFIALTAELIIAEEEARLHALTEAAKIIQAEAKDEIGNYQDAAGPFAAWPELADATQERRTAMGFPANEPLLMTGDLRDSIEYTVEGHEADIGSNDEKAKYQELGTDTIPPRSFLGGSGFRKADEVAELIGSGAVRALIGGGRNIPIP